MSVHRRSTSRRASAGRSSETPASRRPLAVVVLLAVALLYLGRFLTSGEKRAEIYQTLGRVYLLLPDELLRFLWNEWTQGGSPALWDRTAVFGVAAILLGAAWGAGRICLPRAAAAWLSRLELYLFSLAIGLNIWSLYALLVGLFGGLKYPWLFRAPMLGAICWGAWVQWKHQRAIGSADQSATNPEQLPSPTTAETSPPAKGETFERRWLLGLASLSVPLVAMYLLTAALPPWEFDVREYHLQVPKEWFQQGRVDFLPHNVYGNMPLGAEMQALLGMLWMPGPLAWWWGALAGKVAMSTTAIWTALALFAFGRRYATAWAGAIAAVVYLSLPWVFHVSTVGLIDGVVGFYLWMTWHAVVVGMDAIRRPAATGLSSGDPQPFRAGGQLLALAGHLAGAAVACKYTALVFVGLPCLCYVTWQLLRPRRATLEETHAPPMTRPMAWRIVGTCGLLFAVACGPWFAKNAVLTGNPVYPLAYRFFGGRTWNEEKNDRWLRGHGPPHDMQGRQFSVSQLGTAISEIGWSHDFLSLLAWPLALFVPLARAGQRKIWAGAVLGLLLYLLIWWFLTHRMVRFFVPAWPLVAILAGVGATWSNSRGWRWSLAIFIGFGVMLNLVAMATGRLTGYTPVLTPLAQLRLDEQSLTVAEHRIDAPLRYLNQHVKPGNRVLLVGDAQPFDLEVEYAYNTCWDDCLLETWLRGRTRNERRQVLRDHRISHVLVNWLEIARYRSPGNYGFTDYVTPELLNAELVAEQRLLRPVTVPLDEGEMDPKAAQIFEVLY